MISQDLIIPERDIRELNPDMDTKSAFATFLRSGDIQDAGLHHKALSTQEGAEGGFLVPPTLNREMVTLLNETSAFRQHARALTIATDAVEMLVDKDEAELGWVQELDARAETQAPQLAKVRIPVHEMYARIRVTQKLLDDSLVDVAAWLSEKVAEKMARFENHAFIHGNGLVQPTGILAHPTSDAGEWTWGTIEAMETGVDGDFEADSEAEQLIDCMQMMKPSYLKGAVWLMSRSARARIRKITDDIHAHMLWQPSGGGVNFETLLGHPIVVMDEMPTLVTGTASTSIAFANLQAAYQIVDRSQMQVLRDPYSSKPYVEFYATRRVGGNVINFDAIKLLKFAA